MLIGVKNYMYKNNKIASFFYCQNDDQSVPEMNK